jgi:virginiamycin B lyase
MRRDHWLVATALTLALAPAGIARAATGDMKLHPLGRIGAPQALAAGPDDAVWDPLTETTAGPRVGRMDAAGGVRQFVAPDSGTGLAIATGSDGALWLTGADDQAIGRLTAAGARSSFALPQSYVRNLLSLVAGPDGNLYYGTNFGLGRITPAGQATEFPFPDNGPVSPTPPAARALAAGSDGALWFVGQSSSNSPRRSIGRMTLQGGYSMFSAEPDPDDPEADFSDITAGPDGALWAVTPESRTVHRIATDGTITTTELRGPAMGALATGPDHALWIGMEHPERNGRRFVARLAPGGAPVYYELPKNKQPAGTITDMIAGPGGSVWFILSPGGGSQYSIGVIQTAATPCVVPRLAGLGLKAARARLRAAACSLGKVTRRGRRATRVVAQSPAAGKSLGHDAPVRLTLGRRKGHR